MNKLTGILGNIPMPSSPTVKKSSVNYDSDPENNTSSSKTDKPGNINSSKNRLQAFTLQKKILESSSSSLTSTAGKNATKSTVSQNPVLIGKKTHGTITKMATYIPTETPESTPKPKPIKKVIKKVTQQSEILQANIEMQTRREQLMTLVELGIPLGMIPIGSNVQAAKAMPTKGMPPIKGLLDPEEVEGLLKGEFTAKSKNIVQKILLFKNCATEPSTTPLPRNNKDYRNNMTQKDHREYRRPEKSFRSIEDRRYDRHKRDRRSRYSSTERRDYYKKSTSRPSKDDKLSTSTKDNISKNEKNKSLFKEAITVEKKISTKEKETESTEKISLEEKPKYISLKEQNTLAIEEKIKDLSVFCKNVSKTEISNEKSSIIEEQESNTNIEKTNTNVEKTEEYYKSFRKDSFLPVEEVKAFETIDFLTNMKKYEMKETEKSQSFDLSSNTDLNSDSVKMDTSANYYSPGRESSVSKSTIENVNLSDNEFSVESNEIHKIENTVLDNNLSWENISKCNLLTCHINPKCIRQTTSANKIFYCENTKNCGCYSEKEAFLKNMAKGIVDILYQAEPEDFKDFSNENKSRKWYPKCKEFLIKSSDTKKVNLGTKVSHVISSFNDVNPCSTDKSNKNNGKGISVQLNDFDIESNIESLDKEYEKFMEAVCFETAVQSDINEQYLHQPANSTSSEEKEPIHKTNEITNVNEVKPKNDENLIMEFSENNLKEIEMESMKKIKKTRLKNKRDKKTSDQSSNSSSDDSSSSLSSSSSYSSDSSSSSSSSLISDLITSSSDTESSSSSDSLSMVNKKKWKAKRKKKLKKKLARKIAQKLKKQKKKLLALKKFKKKKKAEKKKALKGDSTVNDKEENILKGTVNESTDYLTKEKIKILKKQKKKKEKKMKKKLFKKLIDSSSDTSTSTSSDSDSDSNKNQSSPKKILVNKIISEHQFTSENFKEGPEFIKKEDENEINIHQNIDKPVIIRKHFNTQIINVTELESDFMVNNFPTPEIKVENKHSPSRNTGEDNIPGKYSDASVNKLPKSDELLENFKESIQPVHEGVMKIKIEDSKSIESNNEEKIFPLNDIRPIPTISDVRSFQHEDNVQVPDDASWDWSMSENLHMNLKTYKKEEWEIPENLFHNPPTLVEVPISDITETKYAAKPSNTTANENCYNNQNFSRKHNSKGYYNIETISTNAMGRLDYDYNTNEYANNEIYSESYLHCIDENVIEKRNNQKISLDDRINMVLQCTSVKKEEIENDYKEDEDEEDEDMEIEEKKIIPVIHIAPSPEKGILINIEAQIIRSTQNTKSKSVSFADGFAPGQDSDIEDESTARKKRKLNEDKQKKSQTGHAYPCPPTWPDYSDPWDTLPPPPPPPGSPPPHLKYYCVQDTIVPLPINKLERVS